MRYTSLTGVSRTATVWSPGPLANSLWVLDDETGRSVVVKVKHGKVENACETDDWSIAHGRQALAGRRDPNPTWRGNWHRESDAPGVGWVPEGFRAHVARKFFRDAPALRENVWRAAVGDQCDQLELAAA